MRRFWRPWAHIGGSKSELAGRGEMNLQQGQGAPRDGTEGGPMERFMRPRLSIRLRGVYAPRVPHKTSMRQLFEERLMEASWSESFFEQSLMGAV